MKKNNPKNLHLISGKTELSTVIGILLGLVMLGFASSAGNTPLGAFIDVPAMFIVFGGTIFITTASFSFSDSFKALGVILEGLFLVPEEFKQTARSCLKVAELARKEGILKLQKHKNEFPQNHFFSKNIGHVIDGFKTEQVEKIMYEEISSHANRHAKTVDILRKASEIAPAMGLVGTLIGLVQMLGQLEDPSKIGPAMAIALLTTLYGAVLSYMLLQPLATKLERNSSKESDLLALFAESIISISKNEGPIILEMKLNALLPPEKRLNVYS